MAAGGALAVDRVLFSRDVTRQVEEHPLIAVERREATGHLPCRRLGRDRLGERPAHLRCALSSLMVLTGRDALAFYDAAAPVVMARIPSTSGRCSAKAATRTPVPAGTT
ncbi:MAG: hypothetical protein ACLTDR_05305 [Adlercreutzia equolifaciens]